MKTEIPYPRVLRARICALSARSRRLSRLPIALPTPLSIVFLLLSLRSWGQPIFTVNNGDLSFLDANKVHKVGSLGATAGSKTLYRNVIVVGAESVDCIITTESITNGSFTLPLDPCPNTIPFDYREPSNCPPSSLTGNQDRFFSPTVFFNAGGGNIKFKFEFIKGGSYNDATHRGLPVILKNVMINSYDIDGNSNCSIPNPGLNQFNDFSGFNAAARATPGSNIFPSYNSSTGMTRFMSTSNCNMPNIQDPSTRIRVEYNFIQEFEVVMGMTGQGRAFFMLDFGPGPYWTPQYLGGNIFDLNTGTDSYNNSGAFCTVPVKLTAGNGNISGTNNNIDDFFFTFANIDIVDGNSEYLTTDVNNSSAHIRLGSPFSGSQTFTVGGIVYRADKSDNAGYRTMRISRNDGGKMTEAQAEALIDAFHYYNTVNTPGIRRFRIWYREGTATSTFGFFELYGGCMILKAKAMDFTAIRENAAVRLDWRTEDLSDIAGYSLERSSDGSTWMEVGRFTVEKNIGTYSMRHIDRPLQAGVHQYRLVERYVDGRFGHSPVRTVNFSAEGDRANPYPNPVTDGTLNLLLERDGEVRLFDLSMKQVMQRVMKAGRHRLDLGTLPKGLYILRVDGRLHRILIQ